MLTSNPKRTRRLICLSNVFDYHYLEQRDEKIDPCLSAGKRRDLFGCLQLATGLEPIVLSSPPKAAIRRGGRWLKAMETRFDRFRQLFSENWDAPKFRIPCSWLFYARHVLRETRNGDILIIDNYEFIYIFAAWFVRLFRKVSFFLEYEDGKHLIDRSIWSALSGLAEFCGRPLLSGAFLAHPGLSSRLPEALPTELVPGFVTEKAVSASSSDVVSFLYSGSLDKPRGIDLLLATLEKLPPSGWTMEISGAGPEAGLVRRASENSLHRDKLTYHGTLSDTDYHALLASCQVGMNCQRTTDPISSVTFPSKVFTYLSAGLLVISSRASQVDEICGPACLYYDGDDPCALAARMRDAIENRADLAKLVNLRFVQERYSLRSTAERLQRMMEQTGVI